MLLVGADDLVAIAGLVARRECSQNEHSGRVVAFRGLPWCSAAGVIGARFRAVDHRPPVRAGVGAAVEDSWTIQTCVAIVVANDHRNDPMAEVAFDVQSVYDHDAECRHPLGGAGFTHRWRPRIPARL